MLRESKNYLYLHPVCKDRTINKLKIKVKNGKSQISNQKNPF